MTAAALLVVLGAAVLMQIVGMSMALGAFLAGVLLAESSYRHELEADIEPFRGLLLALFFMGVGMTIDMKIVWANLWLVIAAAVIITLLKAGIVWALFRVTCARRGEALQAGSVLTGAGEFAFVLLPLGTSLGILNANQGSLLSAIAAITLLIGPPFASLTELVLRRFARGEQREADDFADAHGSVLVIGFGRFGQIVSQYLLAEEIDVTAIDLDPDMIQVAGRFGFKVYYGDGTRLDVLRAAGLDKARLIAICIDDQEEKTNRIVDLVQGGISRHQDLRALLRPRPYAATARQGRRLRAARDLRIRDALRPEGAGGDGHRSPTARRSWRTSSAPATATASPFSRRKASTRASTCCANVPRRGPSPRPHRRKNLIMRAGERTPRGGRGEGGRRKKTTPGRAGGRGGPNRDGAEGTRWAGGGGQRGGKPRKKRVGRAVGGGAGGGGGERTGRRGRNDFGKSCVHAPAVDAPLMRAAHQNCGRIAPYRFGEGVANVPPGKADVGEHAVIEARENRGIVTAFDELDEFAQAKGHDPRCGIDQPRELRGGLGIGIERHGILHPVESSGESGPVRAPTSTEPRGRVGPE